MGIAELPWWLGAEHADEIAQAGRHDDPQTFDGRTLEDDRPELELGELAARLQQVSGFDVSDLSSRRRENQLTQGRIDMTAIAVGRCGHRVRDVAILLRKSPGTVSRWLSLADRRSLEDPSYRRHLDDLDRAISAQPEPNVTK